MSMSKEHVPGRRLLRLLVQRHRAEGAALLRLARAHARDTRPMSLRAAGEASREARGHYARAGRLVREARALARRDGPR